MSCVAHEDEECRCLALTDASVVEVLHIAADGTVGRAGLACGVNVDIEAFLNLPVGPRLKGRDVVLRCDDDHVDRIRHQVRMVGVNVENLAVVEHLLVNDVEIRAVGVYQHSLGLGDVGAVEADLNLDVVEDTDDVVFGVVAHRIDDKRTDSDAAHRALHLDSGCRL